MTKSENPGWEFIDEDGTFRMLNSHRCNTLYIPLVNEAGIYSAITPTLHGDIKADHNTYLTAPVSIENLHDSRLARNFWIQVDGEAPWSVSGNSAVQIANHFTEDDEQSELEAGILWQKISRKNVHSGVQAEVCNFVPASIDRVELMKVTLINCSDCARSISATAAIPIYGRSADNLRDHRHVTSLLNRTRCVDYGVLVTPSLSFDERGHKPNKLVYAILGVEGEGTPPQGFFPVSEDFIGEGGSLDWPEAIVKKQEPVFHTGMCVDGYEAMGGLRFRQVTLQPGEQISYVLMLAIMEEDNPGHLVREYGSPGSFDGWFEKTKAYWHSRLAAPQIHTGDARFDGWMRWVSLQPILRRSFGNSFLPYHDYGRGGRGWRDLWQDSLALLMMDESNIGELLFENFGGVRIDGSNATIIGFHPGEFKADRNNIPRVWMDHGVWPLLTTSMYIDQSGDLAFLLRKQVYFKDRLIARAQARDPEWTPEQGTQLLTASAKPYLGTILEHLLIQLLVPFFNVGEHNNIRLEGADWNDAMDMASEFGESVAFTSFYAGNLHKLSEWTLALEELAIHEVEIAWEMVPLLDSLSGAVDYDSVSTKRSILVEYFDKCKHTISGRKVKIGLRALASDLASKSDWLFNHLRRQEWLMDAEGYGWFNSYYDNDSRRVEGDSSKGVRMILSGQVFALMGGVATDEQAREIIRSADRYLLDQRMGGYRLNSDFGESMPSLGRAFGFAFGHKENGAMFSHMTVMYANALYQRGFVKQGYAVLEGIYRHCQDFARSHSYPGLPEYINERGRGMYPYLTGSASWYLLTMVNEVFGIKGRRGELLLTPKLVAAQFNRSGIARIFIRFGGRSFNVCYTNKDRIEYGDYKIASAHLDSAPISFSGNLITINRDQISRCDPTNTHNIEVLLG